VAEAAPNPERRRAIELAWQAVGKRERTVSELRGLLERKRAEPDAIDAAVAELTAAGVLDDARYAALFAEDRRVRERWGSERIARDLRRRGVDPGVIERTLSSSGRDDELDAAVALLAERFPVAPTGDRDRNRAWQMLVRKGYEPELAYEAVRSFGRADAA
jgi:regulatory protein